MDRSFTDLSDFYQRIIESAIAQVEGLTNGGNPGQLITISLSKSLAGKNTLQAICSTACPPGKVYASLVDGKWYAYSANSATLIRQDVRIRHSKMVIPLAEVSLYLYKGIYVDASQILLGLDRTPVSTVSALVPSSYDHGLTVTGIKKNDWAIAFYVYAAVSGSLKSKAVFINPVSQSPIEQVLPVALSSFDRSFFKGNNTFISELRVLSLNTFYQQLVYIKPSFYPSEYATEPSVTKVANNHSPTPVDSSYNYFGYTDGEPKDFEYYVVYPYIEDNGLDRSSGYTKQENFNYNKKQFVITPSGIQELSFPTVDNLNEVTSYIVKNRRLGGGSSMQIPIPGGSKTIDNTRSVHDTKQVLETKTIKILKQSSGDSALTSIYTSPYLDKYQKSSTYTKSDTYEGDINYNFQELVSYRYSSLFGEGTRFGVGANSLDTYTRTLSEEDAFEEEKVFLEPFPILLGLGDTCIFTQKDYSTKRSYKKNLVGTDNSSQSQNYLSGNETNGAIHRHEETRNVNVSLTITDTTEYSSISEKVCLYRDGKVVSLDNFTTSASTYTYAPVFYPPYSFSLDQKTEITIPAYVVAHTSFLTKKEYSATYTKTYQQTNAITQGSEGAVTVPPNPVNSLAESSSGSQQTTFISEPNSYWQHFLNSKVLITERKGGQLIQHIATISNYSFVDNVDSQNPKPIEPQGNELFISTINFPSYYLSNYKSWGTGSPYIATDAVSNGHSYVFVGEYPKIRTVKNITVDIQSSKITGKTTQPDQVEVRIINNLDYVTPRNSNLIARKLDTTELYVTPDLPVDNAGYTHEYKIAANGSVDVDIATGKTTPVGTGSNQAILYYPQSK